MGRCLFQALCLLAAAAVSSEGHAAGRGLRIRSVAEDQGSDAQSPMYNIYNAAALVAPPMPAPVVHFLFLAVGKVNNIDVWKSFFAQAPQEQYRAYVHCKTAECTVSVVGSPLTMVSMVPSYYCADLVTPMNHLLTQALMGSGPGPWNPADKFVFVSDSTLPAKPFSQIYSTLSGRTGSDFCVTAVKEWATRRDQPTTIFGGGVKEGQAVEMAVKHHQWSVLERGHAERISQIWQGGAPLVHDFLMRFQMNLPPRSRSVKTYAGSSDTGCLDEFYHMAAIYGTQHMAAFGTNVSLPAFTNTPIQVAPTADLQGSCDTFVAWPEYAKGRDLPMNTTGRNAFAKLYAALDPLSVPYSGNAQKPGYWDAISSHGMRAIRSSEFLFVRKFTDKPRVADGGNFGAIYPQLVFQ